MSDSKTSVQELKSRQGLVKEIGKPRDKWSVDDLVALVERRQIQLLSLMHVGGDGWLKTLDFVPRNRSHLVDIIEGGERADGSNLFRGTRIKPEASDIVLSPRVESAFIDPFSPKETLVLLCGHTAPDGSPLPESPDTIIRRACDLLREETGVELWGLGEVEYFLGKRRDESDIYGADDRGYHAVSPFVFGEGLRRRAMAILGEIGVAIKYGHSEAGYIEARETNGVIWEQHEIEMAEQPLPDAADAVLLAQWVLRNLAHREGQRCTTAPMMLEGHAGNGMHFHFALHQDGQRIGVRGADGELNDPARWLIGGLVQLGGALMAFGNRVEGSFARLLQAKEAPNTIVWGDFDRSALIRLPVVPTDSSGRTVGTPTIEFRLPDGSALPHLLMAGAVLAMLHGRETEDLGGLLERTSSKAGGGDGTAAARVPRSFEEVADALVKYRDTLSRGDVFPTGFIDALAQGMQR
ncbi:hypothetical protein ACFL3B_04285 [Gemmatimonadota bacterium]